MMNSKIKIFNYNFYLKEILIIFFSYLLMEQIFSWLFVPVSDIVLSYEKILGFLLYGYMIYAFKELKKYERVYIGIFTFLLGRLVLESLYNYNTFFQQLTMYYILFPVIYALFIKHICEKFDLDLLEFIAKFYLFTYIAFMLLYGRGFSFSLAEIEMDDYGPFSGDGRVIHASKIYMMIIPFLWYLNSYIHKKKAKYLLPVIFCFIVIVIHQHRSVWSCCILALLIFFTLNVRSNKGNVPKVLRPVVGALAIITLSYFIVSSLYPELIDFFADRFSEIFNPAKEGSTGNFRIEQREVYGKMFWDRPFFGWSFEGFEMSNPLVDWWPEKTGQHFHEGYMEMLFYQGIVGFLFKYSLFVYVIVKAFSKNLSDQSIILVSFCLTGLLFSFNYVLPLIFWGHLGLCLYYIEKDDLKETSLDEAEEPYVLEEQTQNRFIER